MKKFTNNAGIAPWKIDSPIERFLERWADKSELGKSLYVSFYKVFDREYYEKGLKFIDRNIATFVGHVTPKQRKAFICDMVYSLHRFGCAFDEYFLFNYPHLNLEGRSTFVTDKNRWDYYDQMNKQENRILFNDKRKSYELFKKYYKRELLEIETDADEGKFYDFLSRHSRFIVKPFDGTGGKGIFVADLADFADQKAMFAMIREKGHVVVEELIEQVPEMAIFNSSSVNTVRVPTLKLKERVVVFSPFLRTGRGTAVVDNAFSGGIFAAVDPNLGVVTTRGVDEAGNSYLQHPDSKVVYPGFQIPRWDEAVALVTELAGVVETNRYAGWDIALTKNGWVMVEGNASGQMVMQYATRKGIKKELETYISQM